ncbi:hypothetical protein B0H12DRAFT_1116994 [Mycena haematopus]|nr:hypothetical protein B0H12DRAFT_1172472 [Mycena haematopus]KAJ7253402.1 hypothetical protein B0H12DRAFT_1116994 [Mycena haematopus]
MLLACVMCFLCNRKVGSRFKILKSQSKLPPIFPPDSAGASDKYPRLLLLQDIPELHPPASLDPFL